MPQVSPDTKNSNLLKGYLILLLTCFIYSGNVIFTRVIAGQIPSLAFAASRIILALLFLIPISLNQLKNMPKPNRKEVVQLAFLGILGITLPYVSLILGLERTTRTNTAIVFATFPVVISILEFFIHKVKLSKLQLLGIVTSSLGLLFILTQGSISHILNLNLGPGELFIFINVLSSAFFYVTSRNLTSQYSPLVVSVYSQFFALFALIPLALFELQSKPLQPLPLSHLLIVLYIGVVVTGVGFVLYLVGISIVGNSQAAIFTSLQHVITISLSVIFLGELLASYHFAGFILVILGVFLSLSINKQLTKEGTPN